MHHVYQTKAIVLSSRPSNEAGKYISVLSDNFGLLRLEVLAARTVNSKFRQAVQDFSLAEFAFVRGKTGNRLTGVKFEENLFYNLQDFRALKILKKVFTLIEKMMVDENDDGYVYHLVNDLFQKLNQTTETNIEELEDLEIRTVYQILWHLGYLPEMKDQNKKEMIKLINLAIKESHL